MTTKATTATGVHSERERRSGIRTIRFLTVIAIVAAGLAIVWTGTRGETTTTGPNVDPAAVTAGLSREALAEELAAIHGAQVSGLSREVLEAELAAIRNATTDGARWKTPVESGLSQEQLAEELGAIHGR